MRFDWRSVLLPLKYYRLFKELDKFCPSPGPVTNWNKSALSYSPTLDWAGMREQRCFFVVPNSGGLSLWILLHYTITIEQRYVSGAGQLLQNPLFEIKSEYYLLL